MIRFSGLHTIVLPTNHHTEELCDLKQRVFEEVTGRKNGIHQVGDTYVMAALNNDQEDDNTIRIATGEGDNNIDKRLKKNIGDFLTRFHIHPNAYTYTAEGRSGRLSTSGEDIVIREAVKDKPHQELVHFYSKDGNFYETQQGKDSD